MWIDSYVDNTAVDADAYFTFRELVGRFYSAAYDETYSETVAKIADGATPKTEGDLVSLASWVSGTALVKLLELLADSCDSSAGPRICAHVNVDGMSFVENPTLLTSVSGELREASKQIGDGIKVPKFLSG